MNRDDSTTWTAGVKRKYVKGQSRGGMTLADPNVPDLTLTRLLQEPGELYEMEKLMCCSIFEGLDVEERG